MFLFNQKLVNLKSNWLGQTKYIVLITKKTQCEKKKTQCETNGSTSLDIIIRLVCLSNNLMHFMSTLLSHTADRLPLFYRKEKHGYNICKILQYQELITNLYIPKDFTILDYISCKTYIYTNIHIYTYTHITIL